MRSNDVLDVNDTSLDVTLLFGNVLNYENDVALFSKGIFEYLE